MPRGTHRRNYILFSILALYMVLQFIWWAYLLVQKDSEMKALIQAFELRPEADTTDHTLLMVIGEGTVFLILLLVALYLTFRAIRKDILLARAQRNFLLAVTHELRTPTASAKLQLQTLARTDLAPEQRTSLVELALEDLDRLSQLTDKVLESTRTETDRTPMQRSRVDLATVLHSVVERMRGQQAKGHVLVVDAIPVEMDTDLLAWRSIAENLIENAVKYSPKGTTIAIELQAAEGYAILTVTDEGPGVPTHERELIFERFFRGGEEGTRSAKGTGLGLYLCRYLARRLGGDVTFVPRQPKGSIFAAKIPMKA